MQEGIQISSLTVSHQPGLCKKRRCRGTRDLCFWIPRAVTFKGKEVNKLVWRRGFGFLDPRAQVSSGPELKGPAQTPSERGRPSRKSRRKRKFVHLPSPGQLFLAQRPLQQQPPPEDWPLPLRSTRSPPRAGCSSQTSGVCSGGTCGACGGSGSSPQTQSCSSPRSWGRSRRRLGGTSGDTVGDISGWDTWEGAGIAVGSADRTSWWVCSGAEGVREQARPAHRDLLYGLLPSCLSLTF